MEEKSRRRNHGGGTMEEESCRMHHGGDMMEVTQEPPGGTTQEAPADTQETLRRQPGGTQEVPRRHPGDTKEAPMRNPRHPKLKRPLIERNSNLSRSKAKVQLACSFDEPVLRVLPGRCHFVFIFYKNKAPRQPSRIRDPCEAPYTRP